MERNEEEAYVYFSNCIESIRLLKAHKEYNQEKYSNQKIDDLECKAYIQTRSLEKSLIRRYKILEELQTSEEFGSNLPHSLEYLATQKSQLLSANKHLRQKVCIRVPISRIIVTWKFSNTSLSCLLNKFIICHISGNL